MQHALVKQAIRLAALAATGVLCLASTPVIAAETQNTAAIGSSALLAGSAEKNGGLHPGTPMVLDPGPGALSFDLGGSDTRKLEMQLSSPITLLSRGQSSATADTNLLGLDATLSLPLASGLSLNGSAGQMTTSSQFKSLGSIRCMNGTLRSDSYTASGCRFINDGDDANRFDSRTLSLGAGYNIDNLSTSLDWFNTSSEYGNPAVHNLNSAVPSQMIDSRLLMPMPGSSLTSAPSSAQFFASELSGIDLNVQLGFTTDQAGDIQLGVALTRVFEANYSSLYSNNIEPLDWNIAEPFNSAVVGLEWSKGAFSSGIRGYYREPVNFLNRGNLDSMGTFDVHFTWRTPWKANLSVGASNVLSAGVKEAPLAGKPADRFESIYGRIPYVRYQQDL